MLSPVSTLTRAKTDAVAAAAVDEARAALLEEVDAADVGDHLGHEVDGDRVITHLFACTRAGYVGWRWAVTLTRASRQKQVTVDEVVLLPGDDAIVAPEWVPYRERLQPGDLSPGDLLPVADDDPRLVPTYSFGDDPLDADDKAQVRDRRQGPRPGPGPHPLDRGPRPRRRALVRRRRAAPTRRWPSRRPSRAAPAASWSGSPARSPRRSGCAPTATPTTTAAWWPSTTAAARTRRCGSPRSTSRSRCPSTSSTRSRIDEFESF